MLKTFVFAFKIASAAVLQVNSDENVLAPYGIDAGDAKILTTCKST